MAQNDKMIYEIAAEQALDLLKQGKMPMFESGRQPVGAMTGEAYQGINGTLLSMSGHSDPRWITREQADRHNLFVKKGEKSSRILKQSWTKNVAKISAETGLPERDSRGNVKTQTVRLQNPVMRLVPAFNASQMQDVPPLGRSAHAWDPLQRAEEVLKNSGITVKHDQKEREHYNSRLHEIHMKPESAYESKEQYLEAGLFQLAQAMAPEDDIRTRNVGDQDKSVRDQMAFARAHAVLCSNIGIEANTERQFEHTQDFIETLENSPYTIMEASKLASEITTLVQDRERKRNPELATELTAEKQAMVYASPKVEIDVTKGREEEAMFLGAAYSRKHDHFYIPDNVNADPLLERFEQKPAVITLEAQAKESFTVPYPDRDEAAQAGIVYNAESREYEATREVSPEALERWESDRHGQELPLLTPAREIALVIESIDLDLDGQEPQLTGAAVAIDVRDDIPNQKNGMYVAYQDGSCFAKNNLTQEEVYHSGKGYVLTNQMREEIRESARELLSEHQRTDEAKQDKAAEKVRSDLEKLPPATEQTPYMRDNGVEPMAGIHAKGKNTVIPLVNSGGEIRSSMTIKPDGATVAAPRGQTVGVFGAMGGYEKLRNSPAIIVAVKPAEGAAIGKATDWGVAAAMQENNVKAVVNGLKAEMPNKPVFIVASDMLDKTVREVTEKTNAAVLTPTFAQGERDQGLSTFKDMAMSSKLGLDGVKKQVMAGVEKEISKSRELNNMDQARERKSGRSQELSRA
jgi:antirestriction protein ArdC/phage/plasmid primase-like uncharacterized protein